MAILVSHSEPIVPFRTEIQKPLHTIYVFDTNGDRAPGVKCLAQEFADKVETLIDGEEAVRMIETNVANDLRDGKNVGVIANYYAGIDDKVFAALLQQEQEIQRGTRRILLTCIGDREIEKGLRRTHVPREKIRRVRFTLEDPAKHLESLMEIFRT